ncbi:MAG TPA: TonB-dependent receptor [Pyrinomonadaceae bacterium]|jgi:hypothetical protein
MRAFPPQRLSGYVRLLSLCAAVLCCASAALAQAQSNAADLRGFIRDPAGAAVTGASVTARNPATNITRDATTNGEGFYQIVNLPPGSYEITVEAANFKRAVVPSVQLTVGQRADLDIPLEIGEVGAEVTVTGATTEVVETSRTAVATTIDQQRIDNLPINERNYLSFALTTSTVTRDNARPIGPAPTSGLNFGGQRGRSNLIQVDGADNTDNSVNASRSTVSQEAVQEFQVVSNSYAAEFGRAAGGVVNVVTKGGGNEFRGNVFGFLRHKTIQARNPFAPVIDNDPNKKPPFTRAQYGFTLGGPFDRDRTFFFFAFEQRRRNESGFFTSDVRGQGDQRLGSSVTIQALPAGLPGGVSALFPAAQTFSNITAQQAAFITGLVGQAQALLGNPATFATGVQAFGGAVTYAYLASSGGSTGLNGVNPLVVAPLISVVTNPASGISAIGPGQTIGGRFLFAGTPVPTPANNNIIPGFTTLNALGQPIGFQPLLQLQRIFPVTERTAFSSFRLDHLINKNNQFTLRFGYNPSDITGIQVESQNQSLGQNDFSRTGIQTLKDYAAVASLTSTLSNTMVNEARFNFGERRATFKSGNGDAVASNITGTAFIGRELFSPVVRTETRFQYTDNLNIVAGNHTLKFGGDLNFVRIPEAIFELNFAGLFFFGNTSVSSVPGSPDLTPVQSYGLGLPSTYIQGFGNPVSRLNNKPMAFFAQDSWKIRPNLTLNYGVRYDYELTQQIAPVGFSDPLSGINLSPADILAAQDVLGVQQGFPRDKNNWAPRFAIAWDPQNNGKTVIRAAYGLFYDHPLLAVGFNSDIADAAQQQQATFVGSSSVGPTALINASQIFQGTVIPCSLPGAVAGVNCTPGVARNAQYQLGRQRFNDQTFPGFGQILPFTLPVSKDFEYAYANQANFTIERQLTKDMSISASYLFVGTHHLPHPQDINSPREDLLAQNFIRFAGRSPRSFSEAVAGVSIPATTAAGVPLAPGTPFTNAFGQTMIVIVPGLIAAQAAAPTVRVISPAAANLFRPNAPNYFLVQALTGLTPTTFNTLLGGTLRTPGIVSPFGDVSAQLSTGNANYNALNVDLKRRFADNFQFLASYTWSHSIDDSSDLQTLLKPQNNRNFRLERADSLFDQRHRFVFSAVIASPQTWRGSDGFRRFLSDFTVAPIFEISSGRPFNILSSVDTNFDQQSSNDRPSVAPDGTLCVPGTPNTPCAAITLPASGSLGRNRGITHGYASLDMRLTRAIRFGERVRLDIIAEGFNLFNRFNEAAASPFFEDVNAFRQRDSAGRYYSRPTAAFDPRQFQFGVKLNF